MSLENEPGIDLDKLRSIGHISRRTGSRSRSGREHPESGLPFKAVTDELGNTVTEHGKAGSGVSGRQDVNIQAQPVTGFGTRG
jgi:hypothetical protein